MTGFALYSGVLVAALAESTALVGLVVPGVGFVVAASVLAARGDGSLLGVALAATAGSIAGFGLSYHLGRAGGRRVARWSLRAHAALERARGFLDRFGGWAVFWGHFFGPVRACVALAAGAGGLSPARFWVASVLGAAAWGAGLTATGAALSGGWRLVEGELGRGSLLVVAVVAVLYVSLRVSVGALALGLRLLTPASSVVLGLLARSGERLGSAGPARSPLRAWLGKRLSPDRATGLLLSAGAASCLGLGALFFGVAEGVRFQAPLVRLDLNLFHFLQTLRNPAGDRLFLWITYLGSGPVLAAAAAVGACALVASRRRFEAALLLGGFGSGELLMACLKHLFARPRPMPLAVTFSELSTAFPSNHAFSSVALFGFLGYLFTRGLGPPARARLLAWTGVAVVAVGTSRLYLGAHWASDVAAGYALGGIWLSALVTGAEARRRFGPPPPPQTPGQACAWGAAVLGLTLGIWALLAAGRVPADLAREALPASPRLVGPSELLPALSSLAAVPVESLGGASVGRVSLFVVADEAALRRALDGGPWRSAADLGVREVAGRWRDAWRGALGATSPAYPGFWFGRPQRFSLARPAADGGRWVARCWETGLADPAGRPVWAVRLRNELPPRLLLGVPVPPGRPRAEAHAGLLAEALVASGSFARFEVPGGAPFEVLVEK